MIKEFKEFIQRGNVVDLAVAVVIGAAFGIVVKSFTDNVLMRIIGIIGGSPEFDYSFVVNGSEIAWGRFISDVINFVIIAFAVFLVVKAINKLQNLRTKEQMEDVEVTEVELLAEIRDLLLAQSGGASTAPTGTPPATPPVV